MTATLSPAPLDAVMRERWDTGPKTDASTTEDAVADAVRAVLMSIIGANDGYFQWRDPDADDWGQQPHTGEEWIAALTDAAQEAGHRAFEAYVVPTIIRTIIERLPSAPAELVNHPEAEVLRADLARLEGKS